MAKLAEYGIPDKLAFQIQDQYKEKTLQMIEENPYQLVEDVQRNCVSPLPIGLRKTGELPVILPNGFGLVCSLVSFIAPMETGDTYVEARDLLEATLELLEKCHHTRAGPRCCCQRIDGLIADDKVQQEGTKIFDNSLYFAEHGIHKNLTRLMGKNGFKPSHAQTLRLR